VFGDRHLRHLLSSYQKYYNEARTHLSLHKDAPIPRSVQIVGRTLAVPVLGGLHHQYYPSMSFRQGHRYEIVKHRPADSKWSTAGKHEGSTKR
jgi:hypothetical protein